MIFSRSETARAGGHQGNNGRVSRGLGIIVLITASTAAAAPPSVQVGRVMAAFGDAHSPGCVVSVIERGNVVYQRAVGLADLEREVPLTTRSVFDIASTSKQFTAMSVVLLAQDGKLTLDDDVRKWIPELPSYGKPITLAHLLHHTSGIREYVLLLGAAGDNLEDVIGDDETLAMLIRQRGTAFAAGAKFEYSDSNFFLLSIVVKRASGMPLAEFARSRVFVPLGMKDTSIRVDHTRVVARRALSYLPRPDGGVHTTVADLARWDENFYSGKVGGAEAIRLLTTPGKLDDGKPIDYGLGLSIGTWRGLPVISHGGASGGYRSQLLRFPTRHLSVAMLCNRGDANPMEWPYQIAAPFLAGKLVAAIEAPSSAVKTAVSATTPAPRADEAAALTGTYVDEADHELRRYSAKGNQLLLERDDAPTLLLEPVGARQFRIRGRPGSRIHRFDIAPDGHVQLRLLDPDGSVLVFERLGPPRARLDEYAGEYFSDELNAVYRIATDEKRLSTRVLDRPPLSAKSVADDLFFFSDRLLSFDFSQGWVRFERDRAGRIQGFRWLVPGGAIRFTRRTAASPGAPRE